MTPLRRIRILLGLFMSGLLLAGVTAIPLQWELDWLATVLGAHDGDAGFLGWVAWVRRGVDETGARYPFLAYQGQISQTK